MGHCHTISFLIVMFDVWWWRWLLVHDAFRRSQAPPETSENWMAGHWALLAQLRKSIATNIRVHCFCSLGIIIYDVMIAVITIISRYSASFKLFWSIMYDYYHYLALCKRKTCFDQLDHSPSNSTSFLLVVPRNSSSSAAPVGSAK